MLLLPRAQIDIPPPIAEGGCREREERRVEKRRECIKASCTKYTGAQLTVKHSSVHFAFQHLQLKSDTRFNWCRTVQ